MDSQRGPGDRSPDHDSGWPAGAVDLRYSGLARVRRALPGDPDEVQPAVHPEPAWIARSYHHLYRAGGAQPARRFQSPMVAPGRVSGDPRARGGRRHDLWLTADQRALVHRDTLFSLGDEERSDVRRLGISGHDLPAEPAAGQFLGSTGGDQPGLPNWLRGAGEPGG